MKHIFLFISLVFLLGGCKKKSSEIIFGGVLEKISLNKTPTTKLTSTQVHLDDIQADRAYICDSLAIYVSSKFPGHNIRIYNLANNSLFGKFVMRGNGPNEMDYIPNPIRFFKKDGELKAWLYHVNEKKMHLFNVSKSIEIGFTVFENSMNVLWGESPFNYVHVLEDDHLLLKETSETGIDEISRISYKVRKKDSVKFKKEHNIFELRFLPGLENPSTFMDHRVFYGSTDIIKPDATKVTMGMYNFPQINILDLESGKLKGIQVEDTDWNYININPRDAISYYRSIATSNEYIFALYLNKPVDYLEDETVDISTNIVHIFDWDGNLLYIAEMDNRLINITIDINTRFLYGTNTLDELFCYDLSTIQ